MYKDNIIQKCARIVQLQMKGMAYYWLVLEYESIITEQVQIVAKKAGMEMVGMEHRIKTQKSYMNKIKRKYQLSHSCGYEFNDILRYTYTATIEEFTEKVLKTIKLFSESGYRVVEIKNYWLASRTPYNGINIILRSTEGQTFEIQYHTPESFQVNSGKMHKLYEKQRPIRHMKSKEYIELGNQMFELSDSMEIPKSIWLVG